MSPRSSRGGTKTGLERPGEIEPNNLTVAEKSMVDWILELSGAETGAAAGQNDKNNENSDPVYFCKTSYLSYL